MNISIIGYGKMGRIYDSLLNASCIVDSLSVHNRFYFTYIDEFINYHPTSDLVIVSTPSETHHEIAKKALLSGYNVLCEKPICLSSIQAKELEKIATKKNLILYQSTLERFNPLIKFFGKHIKSHDVERVESYRYGVRPQRYYTDDPVYDLGIHDVDLCFYLFKREVRWTINVGYGQPRRDIDIYMKNGKLVRLDLLNKLIYYDSTILDFTQFSPNNPILEMMADLQFQGLLMNEKWSEEIKILEHKKGSKIVIGGKND